MIHIFYVLALFPLMWESYVLTHVSEALKIWEGIEAKQKKETEFRFYTDFEKALSVFMPLYFLWLLLGLFTFQWFVFLTVFGLSYALPKKTKALLFTDALLSVSILFFAILNQYHFHISAADISSFFKSIFQ